MHFYLFHISLIFETPYSLCFPFKGCFKALERSKYLYPEINIYINRKDSQLEEAGSRIIIAALSTCCLCV